MERALVEVIGAGVVALPDDVKTWLECTLLFHQSDWAEVHRAAKSGLDYLQQVHRNAQKRSETLRNALTCRATGVGQFKTCLFCCPHSAAAGAGAERTGVERKSE